MLLGFVIAMDRALKFQIAMVNAAADLRYQSDIGRLVGYPFGGATILGKVILSAAVGTFLGTILGKVIHSAAVETFGNGATDTLFVSLRFC